MLTICSDLHLTDGTSGETINQEAFEVFAKQIIELAEKRKAASFELVLLGDIFDPIRSEQWLVDDVRPWDLEQRKSELVSRTKQIVEGIIEHNRSALNTLSEIGTELEKMDIDGKITYVIGNHDWLLNIDGSISDLVRQSLNLSGSGPFDWDHVIREDHNVVMRHGDRYDRHNYRHDRGRMDASLGDAIVIELLDRFPQACIEALDWNRKKTRTKELWRALREIDNVRPYHDIPSWILSVTAHMDEEVAGTILNTFIDLFDALMKVGFVKDFDTFRPFETVDKMQIAAKLLRMSRATLPRLARFGALLPRLPTDPTKDPYLAGAMRDLRQCEGRVSYVVFGHTHEYRLAPFDIVRDSAGNPTEFIYFNTGTWRKRHHRTLNHSEHEFIGYHVMTHVSFYSEKDGTERDYEIWHGNLGG